MKTMAKVGVGGGAATKTIAVTTIIIIKITEIEIGQVK